MGDNQAVNREILESEANLQSSAKNRVSDTRFDVHGSTDSEILRNLGIVDSRESEMEVRSSNLKKKGATDESNVRESLFQPAHHSREPLDKSLIASRL